jgi:hypothetical protein
MKNGWTEKIERLTRELADAKSANAAMRDCADQRQKTVDGLIADNVKLKSENDELRREKEVMLAKWRACLEKLLCKGRA